MTQRITSVASANRQQLEAMSVVQLRRYAHNAGYSSITRLTSKASLVSAIVTQQQKDANHAQEVDKQPTNPSVAPAMAAKKRLELLGWTCKGRAWVRSPDEQLHIGTQAWTNIARTLAEVTAVRGEELLVMVWADGECVQQDYSAWTTIESGDAQAAANGMPKALQAKRTAMGFDPFELSDMELIRRLSGMKVTWWNKLAGSEMTGVVSGVKVQIEKSYDGRGNELPADRIVKFNDQHDGGFRAFRIAALIKVG